MTGPSFDEKRKVELQHIEDNYEQDHKDASDGKESLQQMMEDYAEYRVGYFYMLNELCNLSKYYTPESLKGICLDARWQITDGNTEIICDDLEDIINTGGGMEDVKDYVKSLREGVEKR